MSQDMFKGLVIGGSLDGQFVTRPDRMFRQPKLQTTPKDVMAPQPEMESISDTTETYVHHDGVRDAFGYRVDFWLLEGADFRVVFPALVERYAAPRVEGNRK